MPYSKLSELINANVSLTREEVQRFLEFCNVKEFKKNEFLVKVGEPFNRVYFVNKGICVSKTIDYKGDQCVFNFHQEYEFISDYRSFMFNENSTLNVIALEDSEIIEMTQEGLMYVFYHIIESNKVARLITERYFLMFYDEVMSRRFKSLEERYITIEERFPGILNRVPLHLIASFLGVTPIHLSRVRKKIFRQPKLEENSLNSRTHQNTKR